MSTPGSTRRQCRRCDVAIGPHVTFCPPCLREQKRDRKRAERRSSTFVKGSHRHRAKHYGVAYEPIDPLAIYHRDNWTCGICTEPIDQKLDYPDLRCATLDHIHPMALGGGHTPDNVQAAHFICNSTKSHRVSKPLTCANG